jgi:hypothetical protein
VAFQAIIRRQIFADFAIFIYRTFIGHKEVFRNLIKYGIHFVKNSVDDTGAYVTSYTGRFGMIGRAPRIIVILHLMTVSAK